MIYCTNTACCELPLHSLLPLVVPTESAQHVTCPKWSFHAEIQLWLQQKTHHMLKHHYAILED